MFLSKPIINANPINKTGVQIMKNAPHGDPLPVMTWDEMVGCQSIKKWMIITQTSELVVNLIATKRMPKTNA